MQRNNPHVDGPGGSPENVILKDNYRNARYRRLSVESEFTQSVTAVAGHEQKPFRVSNLRAGVHRKAGNPAPHANSKAALWQWALTEGFYWTPINAATGKSNLLLLDGGGDLNDPSTKMVETNSAGQTLSLQDFPWHVRTKAATVERTSLIEMWDDRKWMFPTGTGDKWTPGK
jgi:hypothetical protein